MRNDDASAKAKLQGREIGYHKVLLLSTKAPPPVTSCPGRRLTEEGMRKAFLDNVASKGCNKGDGEDPEYPPTVTNMQLLSYASN